MAIRCQVRDAAKIVVIRMDGPVDDAQLLGFLPALAADWSDWPGMDALVDVRRARCGTLTARAVRDLASQADSLDDRLRWRRAAIVATSDASYGLCRMFQTLRDEAPCEVGVFRDPVEAWDWLGADDGEPAETAG